ncbi:MAG TPA: PilZ domain-containing protein [Polyangiales bacterium]|nr:PilZ domain-containing protein [Polyangiales bacterium]
MDNRRKHARFRSAVAAEIELDGEVSAGTTRDISQGGVSIVTDAELIEGAAVMLTLILTEDGIESASAEALCTRATVMWTAATDSGETLAGLRFEALGISGTRTLSHLLSALSTSSQPPV